MNKDLKILKGVLLLRASRKHTAKATMVVSEENYEAFLDMFGYRVITKEEDIESVKSCYEYSSEEEFEEWLDYLRKDLKKTPEELEEESRIACEEMAEREAQELYDELHGNDDYCPSSTAGDYSPSNPWDAPGMSIRDFI